MKKLRIFLVNVGLRSRLYPLATPPLGIMYIAAYLRTKFSVEIQVVNQRLEGWSHEDVARKAIEFGADILGLGSMTPTAHGMPVIAKAVRQAKPDTFIVLGGPHISAFGSPALKHCPDANAAVAGEGELSMEMIVQALLDGGDLSHIPGLMWRDKEGEITVNSGRTPMVHNLDDLPMAAYDLIDVSRYWKTQSMPPIPRRRYVSLLSSRGCPYTCMWCHNIFGRTFRAHSADRIVEEVSYYKKTFGIDDIEFVDDSFNLDKKRLIDFSTILLKKDGPIKIAFPNALRADLLEEETVDALVEAGMYFSSFALESGSPRIQEFTGKRLNIPRFLKAIELATDRGIYANGFMMLGFPTETEEEMMETIRVATESRLHSASFFTVTPFPGTVLYKYVLEHMSERLGAVSYDDMDFCTMTVNMSTVPDERLFYLQRKAARTFFFKPSRIYRLLRDFPQPHLLPLYVPIFLNRAVKGLFT
jgi:anaerobic magnesium-protoporphyrin IX monomethyl ester cyclase